MILDCFKDGELVESIQLSASKRLYTVGRQANVSDIFLEHKSISREQATLTVSASGSVVVMDVGSAQGTFISGKKLPPKKKHTLPPGRSLVFGKSTRIYKLREGASGFMNDVEAVPVPKQQKRYNETLATALLSVLRRGSLDDSERLRPDGYVPLAALLASSALASFRCTEKEARTLVADTEALELFELRTEGDALLMRAQSGHEARRPLPPQAPSPPPPRFHPRPHPVLCPPPAHPLCLPLPRPLPSLRPAPVPLRPAPWLQPLRLTRVGWRAGDGAGRPLARGARVWRGGAATARAARARRRLQGLERHPIPGHRWPGAVPILDTATAQGRAHVRHGACGRRAGLRARGRAVGGWAAALHRG